MLYGFVIEPALYIDFADEAEQIDRCKQWDLLSEKAVKTKVFYYKGNGLKEPCDIVGYVDHMTAVIQFANGQKHCIHYAYLKEMQAASYGQRYVTATDGDESGEGAEEARPAAGADAGTAAVEPERAADVSAAGAGDAMGGAGAAAPAADEPAARASAPGERAEAGVDAAAGAAAASPASAKAKGGAKPKKAQLPEEKVKMTAVVQEFTTVPNHFADSDDEVIIYEAVTIVEPEMELGEAWSSHSATLKKLELAVGDKLSFEAKVVAKKLAKHPIPYKINNPAKIVKEQG